MTFTSSEDAQQQTAMMMPNLAKFAQTQGVELPEQIKQMMGSS